MLSTLKLKNKITTDLGAAPAWILLTHFFIFALAVYVYCNIFLDSHVSITSFTYAEGERAQ